eukprot:PhF_6_TR41657/c0_g1_i1/m.63154/K04739/PRKAR; cAMP-dependent protein kinase regulator
MAQTPRPRRDYPEISPSYPTAATTPRAPRPPLSFSPDKLIPKKDRNQVRARRNEITLQKGLLGEVAMQRLDTRDPSLEVAKPSLFYKTYDTPRSQDALRRRLQAAKEYELKTLDHYFEGEERYCKLEERKLLRKYCVQKQTQRETALLKMISVVPPTLKFTNICHKIAIRNQMKKAFSFYLLRFIHRWQEKKKRKEWIKSKALTMTRPTLSMLQQNPVFQCVEPEIVLSLLAAMKPECFHANEVIVKSGETQCVAYVLESGSLEVLTTSKEATVPDIVSSRGYLFGEYSLLSMDPSTQTVTAKTEACLWALPGHDFRSLMKKASASSHMMHRSMISKVQREVMKIMDVPTVEWIRSTSLLMSQWTERNVLKAVGHLEPVVVQAGDVVVKEKDFAKGLYLIYLGALETWKGETHKSVLGRGQAFAELPTILGTQNDVTVKATRHSRLWFLNRSHVMELLCHEQMFALRPLIVAESVDV